MLHRLCEWRHSKFDTTYEGSIGTDAWRTSMTGSSSSNSSCVLLWCPLDRGGWCPAAHSRRMHQGPSLHAAAHAEGDHGKKCQAPHANKGYD